MKTVFVCSGRKINAHAGETYDEVVEVPHQPTTEDIEICARRVRNALRKAWTEDVNDASREGDPRVVAHLDAASPFNAMLIDYQRVMGLEENATIELAYLDGDGTRTTGDHEANELIDKLDGR